MLPYNIHFSLCWEGMLDMSLGFGAQVQPHRAVRGFLKADCQHAPRDLMLLHASAIGQVYPAVCKHNIHTVRLKALTSS